MYQCKINIKISLADTFASPIRLVSAPAPEWARIQADDYEIKLNVCSQLLNTYTAKLK